MSNLSDPVAHAAAITPSDIQNLLVTSTALYVGSAGDITVTMLSGMKVLFTAVPVGWHPIRVTRVWATGTTAQNIVAVW